MESPTKTRVEWGQWVMDIRQKIAVITGAASGIGQAVGSELARRGAKSIVLVDRSNAVEEVANSIREFCCDGVQGGCSVDCYVGDVTSEDFRREVYDETVSKRGVPGICIPAAGITRDSLSVRMNKATGKAILYPAEDFRLVLEINLVAPVYWGLEMVGRIAEDRRVRNLGRWMPPEPIQGTIIFIGSVSSQGNKGQISYAATKAGLEGAAATLMKEAIFHGVRCGVIHPGFTDTPMVRALGEEYIQEHILPSTQLQRLIRPSEIADAICFMIANSAVSGELWCDAGWHPSA